MSVWRPTAIITPTKAGDPESYRILTLQGVLMDIIFGIVGAIIGGLIMNFFGQLHLAVEVNTYSVNVDRSYTHQHKCK